MICRKCSRPLPSGSTYCPFCGNRQFSADICPKCGQKLVEGASFCMKCGSDLSGCTDDSMIEIIRSESTGDPYYKKWIAEHKQLAENKHITWISEFRNNYAVAIDDNSSGRELRPFLVRGENIAEVICNMSWTGANIANGIIDTEADSFSNGTRYLSFILFRSNSMISYDEYRRILLAFTGLTIPYATSGIALLVSRDSRILFAAQYQENITGISDIFPLRMIGEKYCVYTMPEEYNRMTNRERYSATADDIKTASQRLIDCDSGLSILDNVFIPKYEGDPSESFVEFFFYDQNITGLLHSSKGRDVHRNILNRKTGKIYLTGNNVRYKTLRVEEKKKHERYMLLRISDIQTDEIMSEMGSGVFELIGDNDSVVINLGRQDLDYAPEIIGEDRRLFINTHVPSKDNSEASSEIYCFEKDSENSYICAGHRRLGTNIGFADGLVHIHTADKTETNCGVFSTNGKTYIVLLKEAESSDDCDKCLITDEAFNKVYLFDYKLHYGSQTPYGVHIFDDVVYALSSEEDEFGETRAVMKNILTNETVFSAEASKLISNASAEFSMSRIRPRYEFGSYRLNGKIYFLIGKQNRGLGIMDFSGNTVIPIDSSNYFIVSSGALGMISDGSGYARLPADMFLIVLDSFDSDRYRVCGSDGMTVFEGSMSELISRFS